MKEKAGVKPTKVSVPKETNEDRMLRELILMNDTLNGIKNILDNMWRERRP